MKLYLHPVTRRMVVRMPSVPALRALALEAVDGEEISYSRRRVSQYHLALSLWQLYERECEEYDRLVCSGRTQCREGITAMPRSGHEQVQVNRNARYQHMKLVLRAAKLRIPDELLSRAKHAEDRWRWEEWSR